MHPFSEPELLGDRTSAGRLSRLSAGTVLPTAIGVAAVSVATAGVAVLAFLSGGGTQPEHVLPAGALAFVKVDLDRAANQKLAVYRLAEKSPASADKVDDEDDVKDQLLAALFEGDVDSYTGAVLLRDVHIGGEKSSGMVQDLPASAVLALSVTGLGDGLATLYDRTAGGAAEAAGLTEAAEQHGLSLPQDLRVLLGDETMLAVFGSQDVALRSRGDGDEAYALAQRLAQAVEDNGGPPTGDRLRDLDAGLAVGTSPGALDRVMATAGRLGDSDRFQLAVPEADDAGVVLYVDVARALELGAADGDLVDRSAVEPLDAPGLTVDGGGDGALRLRLTVR